MLEGVNLALTQDSTTVEKLLFLNKVNIILGFTVIFFNLSILDSYRETVMLVTGVCLIVCSAISSCVNYVICSDEGFAEFIAKDNLASYIHIWIPYLATFLGLLIYLYCFAWYLSLSLFLGVWSSQIGHSYTERRMGKRG